MRGVVDGIWQYGNALGVPNLAGDVYFHESFDDNCLVNVVAFTVLYAALLVARVDLAKAEVFLNGKMVYLSATEYRILLQLAQNVGTVIPSEQLLRDVWGVEYQKDKEILWVSISRLRQKLEKDQNDPQHIVTRSGVGYIMPILREG